MHRENETFNFDVSRNARKSSETVETLFLCDVSKILKRWKKESICARCKIIYENFHALLDHCCLPFRCHACLRRFLHDYMLRRHECREMQASIKEMHKTSYCYDSSSSSLFNSSLFLPQKMHPKLGKICEGCPKRLLAGNQNAFCRKCRLNGKQYFLRRKKLHTNESNCTSPEIPLNNGIESSVEISSITANSDYASSDPNRCTKLELSTRKRKSSESASEKLFDWKPQDLNRSPLQSDRRYSRCIDVSADEKSEPSNLIRKRKSQDTATVVNGSGKNNSKSVKDESRKRKSADSDVSVNFSSKNSTKMIGNDIFIETASASSDFSDCRYGERKSLAKKIKSDNKTGVFQNTHKVRNLKHDIETKNSLLLSKKSKFGAVPIKNSKLMVNISNSTKKMSEISSTKARISPIKSKRESVGERKTESCSVRELEVSESRLNSALERTRSPTRSFTSKDRECDESDILNCDKQIKLEYILDSLPENSGVLFRISSKFSDNFRCPKCNKLFKKVKIASIHYSNCKGFKMKKKMLVYFKEVECICLHCHFHCNDLSILNSHKKSCFKSSSNVSIEKCIKNYSEACRYSCPNCNYFCLSLFSLNEHSCEKELQRMKNCFIGVTKLTKCDLYDANLSKYECEFCESLFFNFASYKKHHEKHKSNEILTTPKFFIFKGKTYVKREIKKIIKKRQNFQSADDIVKCWLEPISNIVSSTDLESDSLFPGLNLDHMIPYELEKLLPAVAEKILAEKDEESTLDEAIAKRYFASQFEPPALCALSDFKTSNSDTGSSDNLTTCLKDFSCKCFGKKTGDSVENKPCLKCLNDYIKRKDCYGVSGDKQNSACPSQDIQESNKTVSSSLISDNTELSTCNANTNAFFKQNSACPTQDIQENSKSVSSSSLVSDSTESSTCNANTSKYFEQNSACPTQNIQENSKIVSSLGSDSTESSTCNANTNTFFEQNSACPTQDIQENNKTVSSSSLVSDSTESSTCNANTNTFIVPPVSEEVSPIEISSVASYYQAASGNKSLDVSGCGDNFLDVSGAAVISSMSDTQPVCSVDSDIFSNESPAALESMAITMIGITKAAFIKPVYNIEAHLKLANCLLYLKTTFPARSKDLPEETENGDSLSILGNCNHDTILQHFNTFDISSTCNAVNLCQSDVINEENCLGLENDINSSSNVLTDNIQHHIASALLSTTDAVPFSLEPEIPGNNLHLSNFEAEAWYKWNSEIYCPFDKLMAALVELEPCDFDVIAYTNSFEIRVTWQVAPNINYSAFISSKSDTFVCSKCYDSVSSHTFLEHFVSKHEERSLYVIIANDF